MPIYVDGELVESFNFPGGECHVKVDKFDWDDCRIFALLQSSDDIMKLLLTVNAIRNINSSTPISLMIPYIPYARQDRVNVSGEPLSAQVMASLINSIDAKRVWIWDPHSDVISALIDNCLPMRVDMFLPDTELFDFIKKEKLDLVCPDAGAEKRVRAVKKQLILGGPYHPDIVFANKSRNAINGEIISTEVYGDVNGKDLIIIDDICDGGATFIALAEQLKMKGAGKLYLYVTHGIFSKGQVFLSECFERIFCFHLVQSQGIVGKMTVLSNFKKDYVNED